LDQLGIRFLILAAGALLLGGGCGGFKQRQPLDRNGLRLVAGGRLAIVDGLNSRESTLLERSAALSVGLTTGWLRRGAGYEEQLEAYQTKICSSDGDACRVVFLYAALACSARNLEPDISRETEQAFANSRSRLCRAAAAAGRRAGIPNHIAELLTGAADVARFPRSIDDLGELIAKFVDADLQNLVVTVARANLLYSAVKPAPTTISEFFRELPLAPVTGGTSIWDQLGVSGIVDEQLVRLLANSETPIALGGLCPKSLERARRALDSPLRTNLARRLASLCVGGEGCEAQSYEMISSVAPSPQPPPDTPAEDRRRWNETWDRRLSVARLVGEAAATASAALPMFQEARNEQSQLNRAEATRLLMLVQHILAGRNWPLEAAAREWRRAVASAAPDQTTRQRAKVYLSKAMTSTLLFHHTKKIDHARSALQELEESLRVSGEWFVRDYLHCPYDECAIPVIPFGPERLEGVAKFASFRAMSDWQLSTALELAESGHRPAWRFIERQLIPAILARRAAIQARNTRVLAAMKRERDSTLGKAIGTYSEMVGMRSAELQLKEDAFRRAEREAVSRVLEQQAVSVASERYQIAAIEQRLGARFSRSTAVLLLAPFRRYRRIVGWEGASYEEILLAARICAPPCQSRVRFAGKNEFQTVADLARDISTKLSTLAPGNNLEQQRRQWEIDSERLLTGVLAEEKKLETIRELVFPAQDEPRIEQLAVIAEGPASLIPLHGLQRNNRYLAEDTAVVSVPNLDALFEPSRPLETPLSASCIHGIDYSGWKPSTPSFSASAGREFQEACRTAQAKGLLAKDSALEAAPGIGRHELIGSARDAYFIQAHGFQNAVALQGPFADFSCAAASQPVNVDASSGDSYLKLCWRGRDSRSARLSYLDLLFLNDQPFRLAFLTSCQAGSGRAHWGRGMNSLAEALQLGGAQFVVSPAGIAWDRQAARMFAAFLGGYRAGEYSPGQWFQRAQVALIALARAQASRPSLGAGDIRIVPADWILFAAQGQPGFL
jgi:hypothetical protein